MRKGVLLGLLVILSSSLAAGLSSVRAEQAPASGAGQEISYDNWLAAKATAEKYDQEGKFVEALQHYLEYTRQAEGLGSQGRVAWGKNNAAYMIIKMHMQDPTVDLAPAKKMLEEGLAIAAATDDCRRALSMNLEYAKLFLRLPD
jgi:hypothetical protein